MELFESVTLTTGDPICQREPVTIGRPGDANRRVHANRELTSTYWSTSWIDRSPRKNGLRYSWSTQFTDLNNRKSLPYSSTIYRSPRKIGLRYSLSTQFTDPNNRKSLCYSSIYIFDLQISTKEQWNVSRLFFDLHRLEGSMEQGGQEINCYRKCTVSRQSPGKGYIEHAGNP